MVPVIAHDEVLVSLQSVFVKLAFDGLLIKVDLLHGNAVEDERAVMNGDRISGKCDETFDIHRFPTPNIVKGTNGPGERGFVVLREEGDDIPTLKTCRVPDAEAVSTAV